MKNYPAGDGTLLNPTELDSSARKGRLGELVVGLIAASAGFLVAKTDPDRDGTDLTISSRNSPFPKLDFQVKCTHEEGVDPASVVYSLAVDQYERLRAPALNPRFLAVLVVPMLPSHWLRQTAQKITVRRCCYWTRMSGLPAVPNQYSVTIRLPRANLLTAEAVSALMQEAREKANRL